MLRLAAGLCVRTVTAIAVPLSWTGRPTAAEAADQLNAAAQVARRVDREGGVILTDYARQLRRATSTAVGYDVFVDALAALAGIIRAATLTPQ